MSLFRTPVLTNEITVLILLQLGSKNCQVQVATVLQSKRVDFFLNLHAKLFSPT